MKTIGLIGGMSWESTASYYSEINTGIKQALGGLHSAKIVMVSVDFAEIESLQNSGEWSAAGDILAQAASNLELAGADFFLICTNTMHIVAHQVQSAVSIPLLHIADATAAELIKNGVKTVGLLGTNFTMEERFYKGRLEDQFGLTVVIPDVQSRQVIHQIIYNELCLGEIKTSSRQRYLDIMLSMQEQGCDHMILGCTEIGLLITQADTEIQLYDTAEIHAQAAVMLALAE